MNKNIGNNDKAIRIIAGAILFPIAVLGMSFMIPATEIVRNIVALIGLDFLITGAIGSSPLYGLFGINTNKKGKKVVAKKTVAVKKTVKPAAKRRAPAKKRVVKAKPVAKRRAPAKKKTVSKKKK